MKYLKPSAFRWWTMFYFAWKYSKRCFKISFFSSYEAGGKGKCLFLALIGAEKYWSVRIHGGIEKDHPCPSAVTTERWWEGLMDTCAGGQQHRSRRGSASRRKQDPWEHPRPVKKRAWSSKMPSKRRERKRWQDQGSSCDKHAVLLLDGLFSAERSSA